MPLGPGVRLGPYEVVAAIGAGGMGEVYRARDTRLNREVALKVLLDLFAADTDRLARFEREAQLLASLNHPNIAIIHGLEESGGVRALVMELVEGPTLGDRIADGPIPLDEALPIARQIAEALEAAHERGVIHRDLKPANIKITPNGQVKVLDFGLAKMLEREPAASGMLMSPTLSVQATYAGVILGTAAYMSPEQARGKPADRRADIWAFGCVLFEMLTGEQAFDPGETVSDAVAAILRTEPDWNALPADTLPNIRTLLRRCLQKDPQKRLPHIGIARIEIEEPAQSVAIATAPAVTRSSRYIWPLTTIAIVAMLLLFVAWRSLQDDQPTTAAPEMRLEIVTPTTTDPLSFALSPDGKQIVFVATGNGSSRLWLRPLALSSARPLDGTEDATYPFWSPDSRSIGFFAEGKLKRLDLTGGSPQVWTTLTTGGGRGGTWNENGDVLFGTTGSGLLGISASGGPVRAITNLERQTSTSHRFPKFLPNGRQFLFYAQGALDTQGIYLGSLDSPVVKRLTDTDTAGIYTTSGWLLWVRAGSLFAQRLDAEQGTLVGNQVTIADPVGFDNGFGVAAISVSASGLIAYRGGAATRRQLIWFDRHGQMLGTFGTPDESYFAVPRLSPDGRRVVAYRIVQGNADVWLLDGTHTSRFTFDPALDRFPAWSPDGTRIAFDSNRKGHRDLYVKAANGAGGEELLLESPVDKTAQHWSPDGRFLMYQNLEPRTGYDLWVLPMSGNQKPWPFVVTNFNTRFAQFSPDGRWVAYSSDETGRYETYVRPFVQLTTDAAGSSNGAGHIGGQWQVSTGGGIFPRWRSDGKELYYVASDGRIMAVEVTSTASAFEAAAPVPLFRPAMFGGGTNPDIGRQYDVSRDGRFLVNVALDVNAAPITILQNWKPPSN